MDEVWIVWRRDHTAPPNEPDDMIGLYSTEEKAEAEAARWGGSEGSKAGHYSCYVQEHDVE